MYKSQALKYFPQEKTSNVKTLLKKKRETERERGEVVCGSSLTYNLEPVCLLACEHTEPSIPNGTFPRATLRKLPHGVKAGPLSASDAGGEEERGELNTKSPGK